MKPYQYQFRKGRRKVSWKQFHQMCQRLSSKVSGDNSDIIIGIARAGLYPATLVAGMLRKEFFPVRVTRRENDKIKWKKPIWKIDVPNDVKGAKILVIDDVCDSGETLSILARRVKEKGAKQVNTAVLIAHSWAKPKPNYEATKSDKCVIFPWDTQILVDGKWRLHPELAGGMKSQKHKK